MSVSVMVRKCVSAIYHASSYSYFTDDLGDTDAHRCPSPLDIVHSRPKDKWGRVILLVRSRCHLWRKAFCWRGRNTKISGLLTANVIPGRRRTAYPPFSPEHRQPQAEEQKKKNHRQVTRAEQENDNNHIKREEEKKVARHTVPKEEMVERAPKVKVPLGEGLNGTIAAGVPMEQRSEMTNGTTLALEKVIETGASGMTKIGAT